MARFLGGFLAVLVLVCCIAAGAMGGCAAGIPLTMLISSRWENSGGVLWGVLICLGAAAGLYFGIRAAKAVFRSVSNPQPLVPPAPPLPREDEEG